MSEINKKNMKFDQIILMFLMYFFIYSNLGIPGIMGRYKYILGMIFFPIIIIIYLNNRSKLLKTIKVIFNKNIIILLILILILMFSNCINITENFLEANPLKELGLNFFFDIVYLLFFVKSIYFIY